MRVNGKYRFKKRFLILFCVLGYVVFSFGQQFYKIYSINNEISSCLNDKAALVQEQKGLEEEISLLQNKSYIERIAREDLGMIRPGETLLVPGQTGDIREAKSLQSVSDNIH